MHKRGRPKVPKNKARVPGISVRLTTTERKLVDGAITRSGLTQSEWCRQVLTSAAAHRALAAMNGR
jgi:hypothetical protein